VRAAGGGRHLVEGHTKDTAILEPDLVRTDKVEPVVCVVVADHRAHLPHAAVALHLRLERELGRARALWHGLRSVEDLVK
jgi:hypothetical protein